MRLFRSRCFCAADSLGGGGAAPREVDAAYGEGLWLDPNADEVEVMVEAEVLPVVGAVVVGTVFTFSGLEDAAAYGDRFFSPFAATGAAAGAGSGGGGAAPRASSEASW